MPSDPNGHHRIETEVSAAQATLKILRDSNGAATDFRMLSASDSFLKCLGLGRSAVSSLLATDYFGSWPAPGLDELEQILSSGLPSEVECYLPLANGRFGFLLTPVAEDRFTARIQYLPGQHVDEHILADRLEQQERLLECAHYLTDSLEISKVLERIGATAGEILAADGYAIYLLEQDGSTLTPMVAYDPPDTEAVMGTPLDVEHSFTGEAVRQRRGLVFNDAYSNPRGMPIPGSDPELEEQVLAVPFCYGDEVLGAMCLDRVGKQFEPADLALAQEFAIYATTAIRNAQLHGRVQREVAERQAARQAQHEAEMRLSAVVDSIDDLIIYQTPDHRVIWANSAVSRASRLTPEELVGRHCHEIWFNCATPCEGCPVEKAAHTRQPHESETTTPDGRHWFIRGAPVLGPMGELQGLVEIAIDITGRHQAQERMRQITKMEALGRLAGDVAHDFNNQLTVIIGDSQLLLSTLPESTPIREELEEISNSGCRAAALTKRLLLFSRREDMDVQLTDINDTIRGVYDVLQRLIGDTVQLCCDLDSGIGQVRTDPAQMEQALINLAINARDAILDSDYYSGKLTIRTRNVYLDATQIHAWPGLRTGRYVQLDVSDTGTGMLPDVRERIFEPFFTTKEAGKGTGLGLSIVYSVVTQSGGVIDVESAPDEGTTFVIYLPVTDPSDSGADTWLATHADPEPILGTVLLMGDATETDDSITGMLRLMGLEVVRAGSSEEFCNILQGTELHIDLIITQLANGEGAFERACRTPDVPTTPVLYLTDPHASQKSPALSGERTFTLNKPFSLEDLADQIARALGA